MSWSEACEAMGEACELPALPCVTATTARRHHVRFGVKLCVGVCTGMGRGW